MLAGAVTAATISIRPAHLAHSSASFRKTRQIMEAHGNRAARGGRSGGASGRAGGGQLSGGSPPLAATTSDRAAKAGARTPW